MKPSKSSKIVNSWVSPQMNTIFFRLLHNVVTYKSFSSVHLHLSKHFTTLSSSSSEGKRKGLDQALRILKLITPKPTLTHARQNHLNLVQSCLVDKNPDDHNIISFRKIPLEEVPNRDFVSNVDKNSLSTAISYCGYVRGFIHGIQLHCLAIKTGFDSYVYIGTSLVNLYAKCGDLVNAYKVFVEMPERNVVSWTSIIAGFSQNLHVYMCLKLYHQMRHSNVKPNDYTFTSLLSAYTGNGFLVQGRIAHSQIILMGFDSYTDISNALISMYSKCGDIQDAVYSFETMERRDIVSWNSMIAGYSLHGLSEKAIKLHEEMQKLKIKPDGITFLGILSSCRHGGLVEISRHCFNLMLENGVKPDLDHYSCMVDSLGRAGLLEEAKVFIEEMPVTPNAVIWGSLLSSCRLYGNVAIGIHAAEKRLLCEPDCAATHVQLSKFYAIAGRRDQTVRIRKLMKDRNLKTNPGYSWIEIKNEIVSFGVDDGSNIRATEIFDVVDSLVENMNSSVYDPNLHQGIQGFEL
ncbi:pentatricopeptide repeat-containing protein At2g37320-like isoform X1 [Papaver somniferum]|uniref:pentatricopeptide repeat-containing protein At2g37320-like isoform X1 n=1 Tax=Papaver somniferum TaxID=3469 RepID=UPI000E6FC59C|nr:pentatricopeptide repeat-containing protein At2g37320-like isoform X1 [Papaver somniferum]